MNQKQINYIFFIFFSVLIFTWFFEILFGISVFTKILLTFHIFIYGLLLQLYLNIQRGINHEDKSKQQ